MKHIILQKSNFHKQGGLEKHSWRIACAFANKGYDVSILTTGTRHHLPKYDGITFHNFQPRGWPSFRRIEQFDRFCQKWQKKHRANIVFGMDRNRVQTHLRAGNGVHASYLETRLYSEGERKKKMCSINPLHRTILEIEKTSFEHPALKKLITNSYMVRKEIQRFYNIDPNKICVVHNGVEWEEKQNDFNRWQEKKNEYTSKFKLEPNTYQFLFIGHGYVRKGLKPLLHALALLDNKNFHLSIIGKEKNIREFMIEAHKLGLEKHVTFFGSQRNTTPFYQLADCLIIPSFYDPFANVTIEALAMGLFVVSSKTNGGNEILTKQNGIIIDDLIDIFSIKEAVTIALSHPKTQKSAELIRSSVKYLDFSKQLNTLIDLTLANS